jgi:hypothetical protein
MLPDRPGTVELRWQSRVTQVQHNHGPHRPLCEHEIGVSGGLVQPTSPA